MAAPLRPVVPADRRLRAVPVLTLALFLGPIAAGLLGTLLPAFGILPALGGTQVSLAPWRALAAAPGLGHAVLLTVGTGWVAALLSTVLSLAVVAAGHGTAAGRMLGRLLAPLLAVPHAAMAIGLGFLIAPAGWLVRLLSPWATGWIRPPDFALVNDPHGIALTAGLVVKEVPFLLLMLGSALSQVPAERTLWAARALGYGPVTAWVKTVLPLVWPQVRLPVYAVLAFSLSVVDQALILGPATPPTLAVLVLRWFGDPDLSLRFQAAAGACLSLLLVAGSIGLCRLLERAAAAVARGWLVAGGRGGSGAAVRRCVAAAMGLLLLVSAGSIAGLAVWSLARRWRFPDALPDAWTLETWADALPRLAGPALTTTAAGLAASAIALVLALGCLENEVRAGLRPSARGLWLLYLPLLVPQISFLFGIQVLLAVPGWDGSFAALVWSHLLFVLPYVFLALADPWRALDPRYARIAACLGVGPARVFFRVKLPLLRRPILAAAAIGLSVSVAQYLPTLFVGAGRLPTLTTEAVGLAAGADRRIAGVTGFAQAVVPLAGFALALALSPRRRRR